MVTNSTLLRQLLRYTPRRVDIIYSDPKDLKKYPTDNELRSLIKACERLNDPDALGLINQKYDIDRLFEKEEIEKVSDEERQKAVDSLNEFMRKFDPDFDFFGKKQWEEI